MFDNSIKRLNGSTYFLPLSSTNVGIYIAKGKRAILIDSGSGEADAKVILDTLKYKGWTLEAILHTHGHLDVFGGSYYLQKLVSPPPKVYASKLEAKVIENPRYLQPVSTVQVRNITPSKSTSKFKEEEEDIWDEYDDDEEDEYDELKKNKKTPQKVSKVSKIETVKENKEDIDIEEEPKKDTLIKGVTVNNYLVPNKVFKIPNTDEYLEIVDLGGHTPGQVGIVTPNNVIFIGDSILTADEIAENPIPITTDVSKTIKTLEYLKNCQYNIFVPSHGKIIEFDISTEVFLNQQQLEMVKETILMHLQLPRTTDELVALIFASFELEENVNLFYSINNTVKAFMEYLRKDGKVKVIFEKGQSRWFAI